MAINDSFMLPKRVRTMEQMADLLAAEQAELDQTQRTITALENQLTISTSTHLLPRHERLFALPVNTTESLEMRRARVLIKLNSRVTTTPKIVRTAAERILGVPVRVTEHYGEYRVELVMEAGFRPDGKMSALREQLEQIMPAHLDVQILIRIWTWYVVSTALGSRCSTSKPPKLDKKMPGQEIRYGVGLGPSYSVITALPEFQRR